MRLNTYISSCMDISCYHMSLISGISLYRLSLILTLTWYNSTQPTERTLDDSTSTSRVQSINKGRGQEITGVTLPEKGKSIYTRSGYTCWYTPTYLCINLQYNIYVSCWYTSTCLGTYAIINNKQMINKKIQYEVGHLVKIGRLHALMSMVITTRLMVHVLDVHLTCLKGSY